MKVRCSAVGVFLVLCVFTFVILPRPALAAVSDSQVSGTFSPRDAELLKAFLPGEIQTVRDQLDTIMGDLNQIRAMLGHPTSQAESALFQSRVASLQDLDIARWLAAGVDLAPLQRAVENALAKTAVAELRAQNGAVMPGTTPGFPVAQYGVICSGYTTNSDIVFGYQTALNVAKLVWVPLKDACDQVAVVAGFGGNTSLACIIPDGVLAAAELIFNQYTICDDDTSSAQTAANYARLAYINEQIDTDYNATIANDNTNTATLVAAGTANTAAIVANDNANAAAIVANDNANTATILAAIVANQGQLLKTQIEANLASTGPAVGYYELPLAKGGQLETVRDLVAALITTFQTSGLGVGTAPTYLSQGNAFLASGQYKLAYARYRSAYQQATNPGY